MQASALRRTAEAKQRKPRHGTATQRHSMAYQSHAKAKRSKHCDAEFSVSRRANISQNQTIRGEGEAQHANAQQPNDTRQTQTANFDIITSSKNQKGRKNE